MCRSGLEVKKYLKDNKDIWGFENVQHELKNFKFSEDDQIPLTIWKMGKEAEKQYRDILQSGVEKRYVIRLPIVGPFGVGKLVLPEDDKYAITNSNDKRDEITKTPSDLEITEEEKKNVLTNVNDNYENTEKLNSELQDNVISPAEVTKSDLFADLQGWSESEASLDDFAEVALLDFAGQYEFYATHQTF
ncbi:unnamed protein product [Mytilus edulis]|uniref:Uncharacterized protein n=1 Tax=Mytilus edulis TaxID=6550 RepID=A0A8S3SMW1_MYTED|nr:unnamed protein product [Mytilus edulis]